jgi:lipopolysaccharide/colanic/teichoic acid biosynthesis glycosyltransferase
LATELILVQRTRGTSRTSNAGAKFKRLIDLVLAGLGLLFLAPLLAVVAIAVKLDSCGPALYISERYGKGGRAFRCFKFRTMVANADDCFSDVIHLNERQGVLFKASNDPRVTGLGRILRKYSLDELPQLFNVMLGDMSLVGPRPSIAREVEQYAPGHLRRFDVIPGITGLWQIQARQDPSFESYISLDLIYIDNWSPWLDLQIIAKTIAVVFSGTGC